MGPDPILPWLPRWLGSPWLAGTLFALWALQAWLTRIRLRDLPDLPEAGPGAPPAVTLCIPARNEEAELGRALDGWLAQDCPGLRILVVDDASTDGTPAILAGKAQGHPDRLRALRVEQLPPGWLGKNHALDLAAHQPEARSAPWLLFADADVQASPDLLRRAFAFLDQHPADLLTLLPALDTVGVAERVFLPLANLCFLWLLPLGRIPDPRSGFACGVGGFMLVRRQAYDAAGGHRAAPLAAVDDMLLARRIKAAGGVNRVALGGPALHLRMYHGGADILQGLRKNLLGLPWLFPLAPVLAGAALATTLGCLLVALGGHPAAGLLLWLLTPPLMAEVHQRYGGRPVDLLWALWPLAGLPVAGAIALAFLDRLRGVNRWRGRDVPIRTA